MPFILNNIRGALKGVGAWIFAIVGIAAFSVVGVPSLSNFQQKPPIKAGDVSISQQELVETFNRELRRLQQQSNRAFTREEALATGLPQRIVQDMSARAVVKLEAEKLSLAMPRALVRDVLGRNEIFQNRLTGKFDNAVLQNILQQNGLSASQFDRQIRDDLIRQNLIEAVGAGTDAPRALTDIHLARQTERRQISWMSVTDAMSADTAEPTTQELQTWYEQNPERYTTPEFRTISIAFLRNSDFQKGLSIPEEELRTTYEANRERLYEELQKRTLYQLTYENEADSAAAVARLREGTPFEILARERGLSLEAATQAETLQSEIVDTAVGEAAFAESAQIGTILGPIKGLFGTTIIQVVDIIPATSRSFDEVREELETAQLSQQTQRMVYDSVEQIEQARDDGTSLGEAATEVGVSVQTFGPVDRLSFTPGGVILDDIPGQALEEAFALDEGEESEAIELRDGTGYLMLSVDQITEPALKPFADVADQVEAGWRSLQRRERIDATAQMIVTRMQDGETMETIAESFERAPIREAIDLANRAHDTISETLHDDIFSADKNAVIIGDARGGSARIVVEIRDISFVRGAISPAQVQGFRQYLGLQLNQELLEAYVNTLREDYDVEINQALIDRIFSVDGT